MTDEEEERLRKAALLRYVSGQAEPTRLNPEASPLMSPTALREDTDLTKKYSAARDALALELRRTRPDLSPEAASIEAGDMLRDEYGTLPPVDPEMPEMSLYEAAGRALPARVEGPHTLGPIERSMLAPKPKPGETVEQARTREASMLPQLQAFMAQQSTVAPTLAAQLRAGDYRGAASTARQIVLPTGAALTAAQAGFGDVERQAPGGETYKVESGPAHLFRLATGVGAVVQEAVKEAGEGLTLGDLVLEDPEARAVRRLASDAIARQGDVAAPPTDRAKTKAVADALRTFADVSRVPGGATATSVPFAGVLADFIETGLPNLTDNILLSNQPGNVWDRPILDPEVDALTFSDRARWRANEDALPGVDFGVKVLQRIADNRGFYQDMQGVALSQGHAPGTWGFTGATGAGLLGDLLVQWEAWPFAALRGVRGMAHAATTAAQLAPEGARLPAALRAAQAAAAGDVASGADILGDSIAGRLARGTWAPGQNVEYDRIANGILRDKYGFSLRQAQDSLKTGVPLEPGVSFGDAERALDIPEGMPQPGDILEAGWPDPFAERLGDELAALRGNDSPELRQARREYRAEFDVPGDVTQAEWAEKWRKRGKRPDGSPLSAPASASAPPAPAGVVEFDPTDPSVVPREPSVVPRKPLEPLGRPTGQTLAPLEPVEDTWPDLLLRAEQDGAVVTPSTVEPRPALATIEPVRAPPPPGDAPAPVAGGVLAPAQTPVEDLTSAQLYAQAQQLRMQAMFATMTGQGDPRAMMREVERLEREAHLVHGGEQREQLRARGWFGDNTQQKAVGEGKALGLHDQPVQPARPTAVDVKHKAEVARWTAPLPEPGAARPTQAARPTGTRADKAHDKAHAEEVARWNPPSPKPGPAVSPALAELLSTFYTVLRTQAEEQATEALTAFKRRLESPTAESPHASVRAVYGEGHRIIPTLASEADRTGLHALANDPRVRLMEPDEPDVLGKKYIVQNDGLRGRVEAEAGAPERLTLSEAMRRFRQRKEPADRVVVAGSERPVVSWTARKVKEASGQTYEEGAHAVSRAGASSREAQEVALAMRVAKAKDLPGVPTGKRSAHIPYDEWLEKLSKDRESHHMAFGPSPELQGWLYNQGVRGLERVGKRVDEAMGGRVSALASTPIARAGAYDLNGTQRMILDAYTEAAKVKLRATMGDHRLVPMAAGVWVTPGEHERIIAATNAELRTTRSVGLRGTPVPDAGGWTRAGTGGLYKVGEGPRQRVEDLARRYGRPGTPGFDAPLSGGPAELSLVEYREVVTEMHRAMAGWGARGRHVARHIPLFTEALGRGLALASPQGTEALAVATRRIQENRWAGFLRLDRGSLAPAARATLDAIGRQLSSVGEEFAQELRRARPRKSVLGAPPGSELDRVVDVLWRELGDANGIVTPDEYRLATGPGAATYRHARAQANEVLHHGQGTLLPTEMEALRFGRHEDIVRAVASWSDRRKVAMDRYARLWLEAHAPKLSAAKRGAVMEGAFAKARPDGYQLRDLYYETFLQGRTNLRERSVATRALLNVGAPESLAGPAYADEADALVNFALLLKADHAMDRGLDRLLTEGLALKPQSLVAEAAHNLLAGRYDYVENGRRTLVIPSDVAHDEAVDFLWRAGLTPGYRSESLVGMGGLESDALVAPAFAAELARMRSYGLKVSSEVYDTPWFDYLFRLFATGATNGWFVPNAGNYLGNFVGSYPMMYNAVGPGGVAAFHGSWWRNRQVNGQLLGRMTAGEAFIRAPRAQGGALLRTRDGLVFTAAELEAGARQNGLVSTVARSVSAQTIREEMEAFERGYGGGLGASTSRPELGLEGQEALVRAVGGGVQAWQASLGEGAHAAEMLFRIGLYTNAVEDGRSLEAAAALAREAMYDVNALSDIERTLFRRVFMFYTWTRKNLDANLLTLFRNPERTLAQLRLLSQQPSAWGLTEDQRLGMQPEDYTRFILGRSGSPVTLPDHRLDPRYASKLYTTTATPTGQGLLMAYDLLNAVPGSMGVPLAGRGGEESVNALGVNLVPQALLPLQWSLGRDLRTGLPVSSPKANEVPAWMMQGLMGSTMRDTFGVGEVAIQDGDNPDYAAGADAGGRPFYYAAGSRLPADPETQAAQVRAWQAFRTFAGRPIADPSSSTALRLSRAVGWTPRRPWESQWDTTMAAFGSTVRLVPSDEQARRAAKAEQGRELDLLIAQPREVLPKVKGKLVP